MNTASASACDLDCADDTQRTPASTDPHSKRARLVLEGLEEPIVMDVARRRASGMTCVRELPFLRVESRVVDDRGRPARIARVALALEKGLPKLVVELAYDDDHDDDGSPPGLLSEPKSAVAEGSGVRRIDEDDLLLRTFHASPIDSLREPPTSLTAMLNEAYGTLVEAFSALKAPRVRFA